MRKMSQLRGISPARRPFLLPMLLLLMLRYEAEERSRGEKTRRGNRLTKGLHVLVVLMGESLAGGWVMSCPYTRVESDPGSHPGSRKRDE